MYKVNMVSIDAINSPALKAGATQRGLTKVELISEHGRGDKHVIVYALRGHRVAVTCGGPVWEEDVGVDEFEKLLEEFGR